MTQTSNSAKVYGAAMPREVRSRDRFAREHARPRHLKPRCMVCGGPYPCPKEACADARDRPYEPPVPKCGYCGGPYPCPKKECAEARKRPYQPRGRRGA